MTGWPPDEELLELEELDEELELLEEELDELEEPVPEELPLELDDEDELLRTAKVTTALALVTDPAVFEITTV